MTNDLSLCESPIERMLGEELVRVLDVVPQHEVEAGWRRYRLDFAVIFGGPRCYRFGKVAVECDGHDFHERTKEQAAHDRSRDRALTRHGWTVLRFTGSEINRDARRCAQEVLDVFLSHSAAVSQFETWVSSLALPPAALGSIEHLIDTEAFNVHQGFWTARSAVERLGPLVAGIDNRVLRDAVMERIAHHFASELEE